MTKIDIISGFLGAGKTTLIKKLLEEILDDEQVVLVENEYGEVGIDSGFLKNAGVEIRELNSGCICCTLVGDFNKSLSEVIRAYHPDRIIIEPSGVGKLSDVMSSVRAIQGEYTDVRLNALVTVANVLKATKQMRAFGEFFSNQIENAAAVVLSRTQNAKPEQLDQCVKMVRGLNPRAVIITTPWDDMSGAQILQAIEGVDSLAEEMMSEVRASHDHGGSDHEHHHGEHGRAGHAHEEGEHACEEHECADHDHGHGEHSHHDHHADEVFSSWGRETPHKFKREDIAQILQSFCETEDYGTILRAKGMIPGEDGSWIYFDMVPGDYELRAGEPEYTGRICVIGTSICEDQLDKLFGIK